jgi:hypothetical protein
MVPVTRVSVARRRRRARLIAVLGALSLALTACTGSADSPGRSAGPAAGSASVAATEVGPPTPDRWRAAVTMQPLTVPAQMMGSADHLSGVDVIAGRADRPALYAATRTSTDGRRRLVVSAWDGNAWQPADVGPGVPGDPQAANLAGNDVVTAIGGWTWEAGTIWPYLLSSTDRRTWTPIQLPETLPSYSVTYVVVDGGRVIALAEGEQRSAAMIIVDPARTDEPTVTFLPAAPPGVHRSFDGMAVAGDTVLLTGRQGATRTGPLLAFRSADAGRSWADPVTVSADGRAEAWGVTHLPSGFVVTGNDPIPDDPKANRRMAAWSSPDGITWTAESIPEPEHFRWPGHDAALGVPTAAGDYVLAVAGSSNSRSSRIFQRQPDGEWIAVAETNQVADAVGRLGRVAPVEQPSGSAAPGALLVTVGGAHGTVVGQIASGVWATDVAPAAYRDPPAFSEMVSGRLAVVRQRQFLPFGDGGYRTVQEPTPVGLDGDVLTVLPWDPPGAADGDDVEIGVDGTAEVVVTNRLSEDEQTRPITGWFRSAAGQAWQPVSGFGEQASELLGEVSSLGGRWILRGSRADKTGGTHQGMLWTSTDGATWSRAQGDFADGDRSSGIDRVCLDGAGRGVAVGWIQLTQGTTTAAVWIEHDGRWQRSTLSTAPEVSSSFSGCSTVAGQLVVRGDLDGDTGRWTLDATGTIRPADPPVVDAPSEPRGDRDEPFELDDISTVPGGFMATGRLETTQYTGRVLWLSADGIRWTWLPVPAAEPDGRLLFSADGADVTVLANSTNLSQAWRIPGIASVIASIPPTT